MNRMELSRGISARAVRMNPAFDLIIAPVAKCGQTLSRIAMFSDFAEPAPSFAIGKGAILLA
jgi:hypothetical protein